MELVLIFRVKFIFIILFSHQASSGSTVSELCADLQCESPIKRGETTQSYSSPTEGGLSFKGNLPVTIYRETKDNFFVELSSGKRGYVDKRFIKEISVLEKNLVEVPIEINAANISQNVRPSAQSTVPKNGGQTDQRQPAVEDVPVESGPEDHRPSGETGEGAPSLQTEEKELNGNQVGAGNGQPDPGGTDPNQKDIQPSFASPNLHSTFSEQLSNQHAQSHLSDINAPNLPSMKSTEPFEEPNATPTESTFTSEGKEFVSVDGTIFPVEEDDEPSPSGPAFPSSTQAPEESYSQPAASTQAVESLASVTDNAMQKGNEVINNSPTDNELNVAPTSALVFTNTQSETLDSKNFNVDSSVIDAEDRVPVKNDIESSTNTGEGHEMKEMVKDDNEINEKAENDINPEQQTGGSESWLGKIKNVMTNAVSELTNNLNSAITESNDIAGGSKEDHSMDEIMESSTPIPQAQNSEPESQMTDNKEEEREHNSNPSMDLETTGDQNLEPEQTAKGPHDKSSAKDEMQKTIGSDAQSMHKTESGTADNMNLGADSRKPADDAEVKKPGDYAEAKASVADSDVRPPVNNADFRKPGDNSEIRSQVNDAKMGNTAGEDKAENPLNDAEGMKLADDPEDKEQTSNLEVGKPADNPEVGKPVDNSEIDKPAVNTEVEKPADDPEVGKPANEPEARKQPNDAEVRNSAANDKVEKFIDDAEARKPTDDAEVTKATDNGKFIKPADNDDSKNFENDAKFRKSIDEENIPELSIRKAQQLIDQHSIVESAETKSHDSATNSGDSSASVARPTLPKEQNAHASIPSTDSHNSAGQKNSNVESPDTSNKESILEDHPNSNYKTSGVDSHFDNKLNSPSQPENRDSTSADKLPSENSSGDHNKNDEPHNSQDTRSDRAEDSQTANNNKHPDTKTPDLSSEIVNSPEKIETQTLPEGSVDRAVNNPAGYSTTDTPVETNIPPYKVNSEDTSTTESGQPAKVDNDYSYESVTEDPNHEAPTITDSPDTQQQSNGYSTDYNVSLEDDEGGEEEEDDNEDSVDDDESLSNKDKYVEGEGEDAQIADDEPAQYQASEISPPDFQEDKDYIESNDGEDVDRLPEGPSYIDTLRAFLETVINLVPDPLHSALVDLSLKGMSPPVVIFTAFTGLLTLILISTVVIIQRRSKENFLKGKLCVLEGKLFKLNAENQVMREDLQVSRNEICIMKKSLQEAQEAVLPLQEKLTNSKSQSSKLQACVQDMQEKMAAQQEAIDSLRAHLVHKEQEITEESAERQKAEERIDSLQLKLLQTESQLQDTQDEVSRLSEQYTELQTQRWEAQQEAEQKAGEAKTLEERVEEVRGQLEQVQQMHQQAKEGLAGKEEEIQTLTTALRLVEPIKENSEAEVYEETLKALLDISKVTVRLEKAEETKSSLESQLQKENEKSSTWEAKFLETKEKCSLLEKSNLTLTQEKIKAQTELEVLANYFKDKETRMQKELGAQEAWRQQKEENATSVDRKAAELQKETDLLRSQIKTLKEELENTERGFKSQLAAQDKKAHENWLAARAAERKTEESKQEASTLRQRLILVERDLEMAKNTSDNIIRPIPKRPPGANGETSFVDEPTLDTSAVSLLGAGNKSDELDQSKRLIPFPPIPMPPMGMPMPPHGMPLPPMGMPLPPPPFPPPPLFGPPPNFMPLPFEEPPFGPPPEPWKMGPPLHGGGGRRSQTASRGPPSPPYSSRNASRQSSPPPHRRIEDLPDRPQRTFSPGSSSSGRDYRDTDSPSLDHPPPRLYDLPPRGGYSRRPPSPHYMDRMPPHPPMGSHRADPSISHLYSDTPPDMRRGSSEMATSSPRTRRSASPSSSSKGGGPAAVV